MRKLIRRAVLIAASSGAAALLVEGAAHAARF